MPSPSLKSGADEAFNKFLHDTVESKTVPATFLGLTSASGELYWNQEGDRVYGKPDEGEVKDDTILHLFSTTKLVTAIACYQLIDEGKLSLHDPSLIERYLPELGKLDILEGYTDDGEEILRKPKEKITLNMLMTHTSGLSYAFTSPNIARWQKAHNVPSMLSPNVPLSAYIMPLSFEPGTQFRYSIGLDWAGFLVERVSGQSLEDYFQSRIFKPCGIETMSFRPPGDYAGRDMAMCVRKGEDGPMELEDPAHRIMARTFNPDEIGPVFMGGGGLFGTARDYLRFLRGILASGPDARDANVPALISSASYATLFTDALPPAHRPDMQKTLAVVGKAQNVHDPALFLSGNGENIGHSPGLFLNFVDSSGGRKAGSGSWDGAAKTVYWLDPATGIAGVSFTNLMAMNPDPWNKVCSDFERLVYDQLA